MWITFYCDGEPEELAKRVWPAVPRVGELIKLKNQYYRVNSVTHDLDTREDIDVQIERI